MGLLIAACGCATVKPAGPAEASVSATQGADLGPYHVDYGTDGTNDTLVLTRGNEKLYVKQGGKVSVYFDGRFLFDYAASGPGHAIAAYMVHIRDAKGNLAFTLMDENADGVFDRKIDYGTHATYVWKENVWATEKK